MTVHSANLSTKLIARNTIYNLLGSGLPIVAAIISAPLLIKGLGIDRFGILSMAWLVIGYFSLFDFGLGRAVTQLVAERWGRRGEHQIPELVWSALCLMLMLIMGLGGALVMAWLAPWLVYAVLKVPRPLQTETINAFYLLACSIPFVVTMTGLRGILEAQQKFAVANLLRLPIGVLTYFGPVIALAFSDSLIGVVAILLVVRIVSWVMHLIVCLHSLPSLRTRVALRRSAIGPLLNFGGWMTVTNIVSPLMVWLDRLFIGPLISVAAVAYYTTLGARYRAHSSVSRMVCATSIR